ncbi:hypothetical protein Leryth_011816 [Lithospermum erythrorhizon]|nr:hypothetical protein Leryth_011816 [Lithospermum erythrorhizon]
MRSSSSLYFTTGCNFKQEGQPHFLDACFLCQRPLTHNSDIFIGNTPFCSQECRQEQIERDELSEKRWKVSSKRSSKQIKSSESSPDVSKTNKVVRTGTVVVA